MSGICSGSSAGEIQWNLLDDKTRKSTTSGIQTAYSMSEEIAFAKKLSAIIRKEGMRQLLENEAQMYQQELRSIGLLHHNDTICEDIRKCYRDKSDSMRKYPYDAHKSNMPKLMRMSVD